MAIRTNQPCSINFVDKATLPSSFEFYCSPTALTAYLAAPSAAGQVRDLFDAAEALSLLNKTSEKVTSQRLEFPTDYPADDQAYRSSKLQISYQDDVTGKFYTSTIPGRNPDAYNTYPRSKDVILTQSQGGTAQTEAFVVAFNTGARSEMGNTVTLLEIKVAGRAS